MMQMKVKLGDMFEIGSGGTPSKTHPEYYGGDIPWVKTGDLKSEYLYEVEDFITEEGLNNSSAKVYDTDTVLIAMYGATIGATSILKMSACTNQACAAFKKNEKVIPEYLYYFLKSQKEKFVRDGVGGAQPNISAGYLKKVEMELPSLEEQKVIVEILDKISEVVLKRNQEIQVLDDLIKARFVEMFGDPISNPMKWDIYRLEECLERIDNGKSFICSDKPRTGDNPAILKLSAATYGDYRPNENKALLDESLFVESSEVHAGDLLFTRKNTPELVGTAAYVQNTPPKLMMPDLIFRLVPNEKVNAVFLWQLINCKEFRPVIQAISGGSAKSMSNISKERLGKIKVICPPRELQDSLIPFVEQTDKSKVAVRRALDEAQLLFDSLMQQYFG